MTTLVRDWLHTSLRSTTSTPSMPRPVSRRKLLGAAWGGACASLAAPFPALASPASSRPPPRATSPDIAVDPVVVASGLAQRWSQAMRRDLGWAARWSEHDTSGVLAQLESGRASVGVYLSHPLANKLIDQGLIHDRHRLARTGVLLVGPQDDLAGIRGEVDPARALRQVLAAHAAGAATWAAPLPGSALFALADDVSAGALSRTLTTKPLSARPNAPAYRLVTQAEWATGATGATKAAGAMGAGGPEGGASRVWLADSRTMQLHCEVARSFRGQHDGEKLLVTWLQRPLARAAIRGTPGWQGVDPALAAKDRA